MDLPRHLDEARVEELPDTAYYIPNFMSEEEEEGLLHHVSRTWYGPVRRGSYSLLDQ